MQDQRPPRVPAAIAFLWEGATAIPEHRRADALAAWEEARCHSSRHVGAGENLVLLTRELAAVAEQSGDAFRARAFVEAALAALPLPRHRNALLGTMIRMATRASDLRSAECWLLHLQPDDDIHSDSEWRLSSAVVATAKRDYATALAALGATFDSVSIEDALDPQASVFRIHALEQIGQIRMAESEMNRMFAQGPAFRRAIERTAAMYPRLELCQRSLGSARAELVRMMLRAHAGFGDRIGWVLICLAVFPLLAVLAQPLTELPGTFLELGGLYGQLFQAQCSMLVLIGLAVTLPLFAWGVYEVRSAAGRRAALIRAVPATARVLSLVRESAAGSRIPEVELEVELSTQPPVRSLVRMGLDPSEVATYLPGSVMHVRVDPTNPSIMVPDF